MRLTDRGRRLRAVGVTVAGLVVVAVAATAVVASLGGPVVVTERCTATAGGVESSLAPDQAANAALITAVAVSRGLPARAATIGIATAIQESKLRNIDYGDRDSLGLFQQRPSQGWGTEEQVMDPLYATNAFYDVLVEVEGYEALEVTDAAQRVQRSAFPDAYGDHEPDGRAFASALTGYSPAALTCRLRAPDDDGPGTAAARTEALTGSLTALLPVEPSPGTAPGTLEVPVPQTEAGTRLGWATAHWAVAAADEHDVVAVSFDGVRWDRSDPDAGWAPDDDAADGTVVIEVAGA